MLVQCQQLEVINIYCMIVLCKVKKKKKQAVMLEVKREVTVIQKGMAPSKVQVIFLFLNQGDCYMGVFTFDNIFGCTL